MMRVPIFLKLNAVVLLRCSTLTWSASGNFWDSRLGKALRHGVHGLLVVLILLVIASMIPHGTKRAEMLSAAHTPLPSKYVTDPATVIVAAHLFGQVPQKSAGTVSVAAASITVDGIVAATNPKGSIAALTLNGKSGEFRVGQVLPDGEKLTAIDPESIKLADGSNDRRIVMAAYGPPDSEGPAAYAALLHGTGLSTPLMNSASAALSGVNPEMAILPFVSGSSPFPVSSLAATPRARPVRIPSTATPLEQLQTLRQQLIH